MKILFCILFLIGAQLSALGQTIWLKKAQMQHDLQYLKKAVAHGHVNPYYFRTEQQIDHYLDSVKSHLPDSLSEFKFWQVVHKTLAFYNDAHTRTFASKYLNKYQEKGGKFFPAQVKLQDNKLWLNEGLSEVGLTAQDQILWINDQPAAKIIQELRAHATKELAFLDDQTISNNFPYYLWMAYGWGDSFKLKIRNADSQKIVELVVQGTTQKTAKRAKVVANQSFSYRTINDSIGLIKIADFNKHGRKYYRQKYAEAFTKIKQSKVAHLVLDFRGHNGGDARYGEDLARYISQKPFRASSVTQWKVSKAFKRRFAQMYIPGVLRWCRPLYVVNKHTRQIWRTKNGQVANVRHKTIKPYRANKRFKGQVFLLTDHFTFSAGSIFAAMFKDHQMGVMVGQPTGNLSSFFADPLMWYRLPNSGIRFQVSASFIVRPNGKRERKTVEPNVLVKNGEDALEVVLKRYIKPW